MGMVPTHGASCSTVTFPGKCRRCSDEVFVFSCSCGSLVLFEELGAPWPQHDCERAKAEADIANARAIITDGRASSSATHRPFAGLDGLVRPDSLKPADEARIREIERRFQAPVTLRPEHNIKPMDPTADGETHFFIGLLRERQSETARIKRLYAELGGVGLKLLALPAQSRAVQITIVDAGGEPNESYTAIADRGALESGAQPGKMVGVSLAGRVGPSYRIWLVTELQVLG